MRYQKYLQDLVNYQYVIGELEEHNDDVLIAA